MAKHWQERRDGWEASPQDARSSGDIDYARVIHCASFRRLQGKTQILNLGDSDFYRTRLTHSLEVSQIGAGIARQFKKDYVNHPAFDHIADSSLMQAIGCTHDLGHPPFGHGGEIALNYCMRDNGGFEGNGQTLRILSKLEKFSPANGSNLARRSLLGVLKYPASYSKSVNPSLASTLMTPPTTIRIIDRKKSTPPKCFFDCEQGVVDWILDPLSIGDRDLFTATEQKKDKHNRTIHKSFDCSIMDLADDISFGVHDLEDGLALKLISEEEFQQFVPEAACQSFLESLAEKYPNEVQNDVYGKLTEALFGDGWSRKHYISRIVGHLLMQCRIETLEEFEEPLIRYRAALPDGPATFLEALKDLVRETVILNPSVQHLEFKGQHMVVSVFEAMSAEPRAFLPRDTLKLYEVSNSDERVISDHIAGMTDSFLMKTYERLFSPRIGSVFDKL